VSALARSQMAHSLMNVARLRARKRHLKEAISTFEPDLIHGLRLPYEGLTVLALRTKVPRVISTWGSDFVPMASSDPILATWTRIAMKKVAGLHTDSRQDYFRAVHNYGFSASAPYLYAAGNFGVDPDLFYVEGVPSPAVVVYPRKAKPNSNYRGFVAAAAALRVLDDVRFVGVGLDSVRSELVAEFGRGALSNLTLTGDLDRESMAALMRSAKVVVSPTFWDGTPVTVLEAVACGAYVIAGDLPELRQLRDEGMRIQLIDANSVADIANAIRVGLGANDQAAVAASMPPQFDRSANENRVLDFYKLVVTSR
jgi:glycosyltransferase involved in cell wall biosynthesis